MRKLFYIFILIIIITGAVFAFIEYEKMPNAPNADNADVLDNSKNALIGDKQNSFIMVNHNKELEDDVGSGVKDGIEITISVSENHYPIIAPDGSTAYDAMKILASTTPAFSFKDKYYSGLGYFVEEINGVKNSNDTYWTLYINGKYSTVGASQYKILERDIIEWKYEKL